MFASLKAEELLVLTTKHEEHPINFQSCIKTSCHCPNTGQSIIEFDLNFFGQVDFFTSLPEFVFVFWIEFYTSIFLEN